MEVPGREKEERTEGDSFLLWKKAGQFRFTVGVSVGLIWYTILSKSCIPSFVFDIGIQNRNMLKSSYEKSARILSAEHIFLRI